MNTQPAPPTVPVEDIREIEEGIHVIPDNRIEFVPNIGIVEGDAAVLVVDCGMGPRNGERVLAAAKEIAGDRPLILPLTHFHPEHGFAAQSFAGEAVLVYNRLQHEELLERGQPYVDMFSTFGDHLAAPDHQWRQQLLAENRRTGGDGSLDVLADHVFEVAQILSVDLRDIVLGQPDIVGADCPRAMYPSPTSARVCRT